MVVRGTNNFKAWQSGTLVFRLLRFLFSPVSSHFFLLTQLCTRHSTHPQLTLSLFPSLPSFPEYPLAMTKSTWLAIPLGDLA